MPGEPCIDVGCMPAQETSTGNQDPGRNGSRVPDEVFANRLGATPEQTCKVFESEEWRFHEMNFPPVSQGRWRPAASALARQRHKMSVASRVAASFIGRGASASPRLDPSTRLQRFQQRNAPGTTAFDMSSHRLPVLIDARLARGTRWSRTIVAFSDSLRRNLQRSHSC